MGFKEKRQQKKEMKQRIYRPKDQREKEAMARQRLQALFTLLLIILILLGVALFIVIGRAKEARVQDQTEPSEDIATRSFTVVLDPGHGFDDAGVALAEDLAECDYNLMVVYEAKRILEEAGLRVHITREQDEDKKALSDEDRLTYAAAMAADVLLSVHACEEAGVYYSLLSDTTANSAHLADCLTDTSSPESEYEITKGKGIPAVRLNIASSMPIDEAARLIAQGIMKYKDEYYRVKTVE